MLHAKSSFSTVNVQHNETEAVGKRHHISGYIVVFQLPVHSSQILVDIKLASWSTSWHTHPEHLQHEEILKLAKLLGNGAWEVVIWKISTQNERNSTCCNSIRKETQESWYFAVCTLFPYISIMLLKLPNSAGMRPVKSLLLKLLLKGKDRQK